VLPFVPLASLQMVANPVIPRDPVTGAPMARGDLVDYVVDLPSAIQLGKALFWDMQVGSDNKVACATCHFQAGGDTRVRNQLHPGANGSWDGYSTNYPLTAADFPFTDFTLVRSGTAGGEAEWLINDLPFDPAVPLATPVWGTAEAWGINNGGGGWTHPMHLHMEEHHTLSRSSSPALHPDDTGKEDVVALEPSEETVVYR
jgi:FtsP/CotA-like multicopper oxidase with cupredoxin domain